MIQFDDERAYFSDELKPQPPTSTLTGTTHPALLDQLPYIWKECFSEAPNV